MYFPYLRAKQNELFALMKCADLIGENQFRPILEPVRDNIRMLKRTCETLQEPGADVFMIINPNVGRTSLSPDDFVSLINEHENVNPAVLLNPNTNSHDLDHWLTRITTALEGRPLALIHNGYKGFPPSYDATEPLHMFTSDPVDFFLSATPEEHKVLIQDGFRQTKNSEYPERDYFGDLAFSYKTKRLGKASFGDYLTVGSQYSDSGGPAYAVALHLTAIVEDRLFVYHFISESNDSPVNPGMKFYEANTRLIKFLDANPNKIINSPAIEEFRDLHTRKHFPGLGYLKRLSMIHHLHVIAEYLHDA